MAATLYFILFTFLIWLLLNRTTTNACSFATQANCPNFITNSYCDINNGVCACPSVAGYIDDGTAFACTYDCGALGAFAYGGVDTSSGTTPGDVATFSCDNGYKLNGAGTSTCVADTGWNNTATTCVPVELGDDCSTSIFACLNIAFGTCDFTSCICQNGYEDDGTATACTETNECDAKPCQNGGTCLDALASYSCSCVAGYEGTDCETDIDECAVVTCQNGGTCVDEVNSYTCTCVAGYDGNGCQNNIIECIGNFCVNGATCVGGVDGYTCTCLAGYQGTYCDIDINECDSHSCANGATCKDGVDRYSCSCVAGYDGTLCENNIDECATNPCLNGATCADGINDYTCNCVSGYEDKNCQTDIDDCSTYNCQNGATCVDKIDGYTCVCSSGYDGIFCQNDIDECANSICQNGSPCVDGIDSYTCDCLNGYDGTYCQNTTCKDGVDQYSCSCVAGYDGTLCENDIDECATNPCLNGATCADGINDYTCNCVSGYEDKNCQTDIDDCLTYNCQNGATCVDEIGGYTCICSSGYEGIFCQNDIDECANSMCQNGSPCVDGIDSYTCDCLNGYDGTYCQNNINECIDNLCVNGATCVDGIDGYTCTCLAGYLGTYCDIDIDECGSHSCANRATCEDGVDQYSCSCVAGYDGTLCENDIDECDPDPCLNGATCTDGIDQYTCTCVVGYIGTDCETNNDECSPDPCLNGATCTDGVNDFTCECLPGYSSKTCSIDNDECNSDPCHNGGTCVDMIDDYSCTCVTGYDGPDCENNIDECLGHSCQNGATCVDGVNSRNCSCVPGYDGTFCENNIDECLTHSCQNGATCVDGINMYTCLCVAGYTDVFCHTDYNECLSAPCLNGGSCIDLVNGFSCACASGFTGEQCRPGELGDDCSIRAEVCDNLAYAECDGTVCSCMLGFEEAAGSPGSCSRVDCGTITSPTDGSVVHSEDVVFESKAFFSCDPGYTLYGDTSVTCQSDATWSGVAPMCIIKDCGAIPDPLNGVLIFTPNTEYQGLAEFSCDIGYTLVGDVSRTCLDSGVWGGDSPVCEINDCGTLNAPNNGELDLTDGTIYQSVVVFQCNNGYTLTGASNLTCQANGTWNDVKPVCIIKGNVTRECRNDVVPQYSCVREQIHDIEAQAVALDENASEEIIEQAIGDILTITESALEENVTEETKLTDGELMILSSSLERVGKLLNSNRDFVNEQLTENIIASVDNLIDRTNYGSWNSLAQTDSSGAESILKTVSHLGEAIGQTLNTTDKKTIVKANIALEVQKNSFSELVFPGPDPEEIENSEKDKYWFKNTNSQIKLEAKSGEASKEFIIIAVMYKDISEILPTKTTKDNQRQRTAQVQNKVNGPVVALALLPTSQNDIVPVIFDPPISFTIAHEEKNLTAPICSFWQFKDVGQGFWSSDGCWVKTTNDNFTICNCDHLTNFAVLMSPFVEVDSTSMALRIISIVGIGISICCILATVLVHLCLWSYLRNDRTTILMNLCVSLFFAYIVFLAGIERTESKVACAIIAGLLQYLYLVVFCVMLVEGIQIAIIVMYVFKTKSRIKLLLVAAWIIPGLIVAVSAGVTQGDGYGNETYCWLSIENGLIWSFVGPALCIIFFNIICIILVIRAMCSTAAMETKKATEKVKASVRSLCVLVPVMGISWLLGIFYIDDGFFFVEIIFTILNGLQGLFIFIFHCLFNNQVRKACSLRIRRRSSMQETLKSKFRSSSGDNKNAKKLKESRKSMADSGDFTKSGGCTKSGNYTSIRSDTDENDDWRNRTTQPFFRPEEVTFAPPVASFGIGRPAFQFTPT